MEREQEKSVMINTWMVLLGDFDGEEFLRNSAVEVRKVYTRATRVESAEQLENLARISEIRRQVARKRLVSGVKKPVVKVNEYGDFIEEYVSVSEDARRNGMSGDSVYKVCSGLLRKSKGIRFKYKKDFVAQKDAAE